MPKLDAQIEIKPSRNRKPSGEGKHYTRQEIGRLIGRVCAPGMHYTDLQRYLGQLTRGAGIPYESLQEHADLFEPYISPDSVSLAGGEQSIVAAIESHIRTGYSTQVDADGWLTLPEEDFADIEIPSVLTMGTHEPFPAAVYDNLPDELRDIVCIADHPRRRDVLLLSLITAASAALGRMRFVHGDGAAVKEYSPHLLTLIVGPAGSGKGMTDYARHLVEPLEERARIMREEAKGRYKLAQARYNQFLQKLRKDPETEPVMEPEPPRKIWFLMSATDTTQAALVEILKHNPAGGLAYDSEIDTLVQSDRKKDFGGFSDVIRKVFHHETLTRQRKGENESYSVKEPRLAILLAGTPEQFKKLVPSEENGLFSRFLYYLIPGEYQPYRRPTATEDIIADALRSIQNDFADRADLWGPVDHIAFTEAQEGRIEAAMTDKADVEATHGGCIASVWVRSVLIVKRIAVTLAGIQGHSGTVPENCFEAAMAMFPTIKRHALNALDLIRQNQGKKAVEREQYLVLKAQGMTDEQAAAALGVGRKTLSRRKTEWGLSFVSHGGDTRETRAGIEFEP